MTASDNELVARVVLHDDRADYGELVQRHQSAVRRFLRHLTNGDAALADDLAQETFIRAHRAIADFRGDAAFTTWVLGIAHNYWRNARRRQREVPIEAQHLAAQDQVPSPASDLKGDLALALHLCYHEGLSHTEISTLLGWPLGTVKTHLARSREKLRPLLAAWNPST